jgi:hypothetical protein
MLRQPGTATRPMGAAAISTSAPRSQHIMLRSFLLTLAATALLPAADSAYVPQLFQSTKLVYADAFDSPELNTDFWEVRQSSTWTIIDGVLTGSPSSKEFQDKKIAEGDKAHAGLKPVIWLKQVPENFVCTMRLRYNAQAYQPRFPLLDLGHHVHTLVFGENQTTLTLKKNVATLTNETPLFTLNAWHDVAIELRKGSLIVTIDGKSRRFDNPHIDMAGQAQIDFKGIDFGTCQIDDVRVWEGR